MRNRWMTPFSSHDKLKTHARTINVPNANLFLYDSEVGKKTILLLHGLGDDADTWAHVFPALVKAGYRVIAIDWPGSGRSVSNKRITIDLLYNCLLPLLEQLKVNSAHLVGHSMGAMLAHLFATEHPDRIQSLTLLGGMLGMEQGKPSAALLLSIIPGLGEWRYTRLRRNPDAAFRSLNAYYANPKNLSAYDRDFLYTRVNQGVWSNSHRKAYLSLLRSLPGWLGKATQIASATHEIAPTVVFGESDGIVSPQAAEDAVRKLGNGEFHVISNAGHNVQQEQPEAVCHAILQTVTLHEV